VVWYLFDIAEGPAASVIRVLMSVAAGCSPILALIPIYTVSHVKERFLWESNINMDLKEEWCECEECISNVAHVTVQWRTHPSKVVDCGGLS
jgi:hypothetical protein